MLKSKELQIEEGKIKLLWLIDSLGHGGAENLMPTILGRIDRNRFEQRVCVLQVRDDNPLAKDLEKIGIPVDNVPVPKLRNPFNLPRLITYLRKVKPDIVHTQLEFSGTLGCLATRLVGIPNITTFHVIPDPDIQNKSRWRHELMWASLRYFSDLILAVSESVRKSIIAIGRLPADKVVTMHNGIIIENFSPDNINNKSLKRAEFDIPEDARVLITVAILRQAKGFQFVLEALPQILAKIPNTYYLIVGDGPYRQTLVDLAKSLQIDDHVRFAGYRTDIPAILSLADIFILPTLGDALPTVLIEAMSAGKPLIASDVGGVPEILQDGVNGFLVPAGDAGAIRNASIQLLTNQSLLTQFSAAGLKIVQKFFNVNDQVKKLEEIYKEMV